MGTRYAGTAEEILALDTFTKLLRAAGSVQARIRCHDSVDDLSDSQFGTLDMLFHLGPLHQNAIGKRLLVSKSNVVAIVDQLEQRGLVSRERSREDRRRIVVHLTEAGRNLVQRLFPAHAAAITEEFSCLTPAEQQELGRLCRKLGLNPRA
ncbi:MAG: MarR family transcriptional regulator [Anaerolineae bacterium]|nr:MarR family transcriptional regulator [Anaerolineae bacterium]